MSAFTRWRIRRFIRRCIGLLLTPLLRWRYQRAERCWQQTPSATTREAAFRAQDRWWHWNRAACRGYVNRRLTGVS